MHVSLFSSWRDRLPATADITWEQFCDHVLQNGPRGLVVPNKTLTPAFSPVEYLDGATRGNEHVISVSMAVLDYDGLTLEQTERVLTYVEGLRRAVYSTYSHASKHAANGSYSFRVVLPLSAPVPSSEWGAFWTRLQTLLPVPSDKACKDPARLYGLPYTPPEGLADSFFERVDAGALLPVEHVMRLPLVGGEVETRTRPQGDRIEAEHVRSAGRRLSSSKMPERAQLGRWIIDVSKGSAWTQEQGQRHATMLLITAEIERQFPTTSTAALTAIWQRSVMAVASIDSAYDPDARLADISRAYEGARVRRQNAEAAKRLALEESRKTTIRRVRPDGKDEYYSDEELAELATLNGCTLDELAKKWVISCKNAYWILTLDGYEGPYGPTDVLTRARDLLVPARIPVTFFQKDGEQKLIPLGKFMADHGQAVRTIVTDMTVPRSYVDEENALREAVCRLKDITPEYDPLLDQYLALAGGRHAGKLNDWLATSMELSKQTCALYLKGAPKTGKTLIPMMLAQMYRGVDGPTELSAVIDNYNEDLAKCPIINVDEGMPAPQHGRATSTQLRSLIGTSTRALKRKYVSNATLRGCLRLIIGANNDSLLQFGEDLTSDDLDAINQRFLCISMGAEVADWIKAHGGRALTERWVNGAFASHVMWLKQNRAVVSGDRFLVEGEASDVQAMTATSGDIREGICQWIVGYLDAPQKAEQVAKGFVILDQEGLWINSSAVLEAWEVYVKHSNVKPTVGRVGRALGGLSTQRRDRDTVGGMKKKRVKFHRINLDLICGWAASNGHGDVEAMRAAVKNFAQFSQRTTN